MSATWISRAVLAGTRTFNTVFPPITSRRGRQREAGSFGSVPARNSSTSESPSPSRSSAGFGVAPGTDSPFDSSHDSNEPRCGSDSIQDEISAMPSGSGSELPTGGIRLPSVRLMRSSITDRVRSPGRSTRPPWTPPSVTTAPPIHPARSVAVEARPSQRPPPGPPGRWQNPQFTSMYRRTRHSRLCPEPSSWNPGRDASEPAGDSR